MKYLRVAKWDQYQHYAKRTPPWIKLHYAVLDNYEFQQLSDAEQAQLLKIWLLASRHEGRIPADARWVGSRIGSPDVDFRRMVDLGFLVVEGEDEPLVPQEVSPDASKVLASGASISREETETEPEKKKRKARTPTPTPMGDLALVAGHYGQVHPRRRWTPADQKAVEKALKLGYTVADCLAAIDGNAADAWHAERKKHELEYVLRPTKIGGFIELGQPINATTHPELYPHLQEGR